MGDEFRINQGAWCAPVTACDHVTVGDRQGQDERTPVPPRSPTGPCPIADHAAFSLATTVDVYFAHPHSPCTAAALRDLTLLCVVKGHLE